MGTAGPSGTAAHRGGRGPDGDETRAQPLYLRIADRLRKDIAEGRYRIGTMLPTETELCKSFDVSRYTVREALRRLTEVGLVQRRAGSGTVVVANEPPTTFVHRVASLRSLLKYPPNTYRELIEHGSLILDRQTAELLGCDAGAEWYRVRYIRRTDGVRTPIAWADFYIRPDIAARLEIEKIDREPVHDKVARHLNVQVQKTEIRIFPSAVRDALAQSLEVAPGTPALTIVRRYIDESGRDLAYTVTIHPENRFAFTMDLTRND